jgi:amidophosphoribosyltransferase
LTKLRHFCGIAGIYSKRETNVPYDLFFPLFSLQHRGQEAAGIAYRKEGHTVVYKDLGMVSTVLSRYLDQPKRSRVGIGHVRYSTKGGNRLENVQPIHVTCNKGEIALAHNGNISNVDAIKQELFDEGSIFQTSSDSELILHLISRSRRKTFHDALLETLERIEGAFSLVMIHDDSLVAVRDPSGFRPLYIGEADGKVVVASETCALDILGISNVREVEPGEIIFVSEKGLHSEKMETKRPLRQCVFELIYFARPDSSVFGTNVHTDRKRMGAALADEDYQEAAASPDGPAPIGDIVVPVPDSGTSAALGYAEAAALPFDFGLTRNHYAGRSFILPTTGERELAVRMKLHPVREVIRDKRVILVDDSLVRGTTARNLVKLLKDAGAKEVHLRLCSPEIRWPCFFGIDIPTRQELISNHHTPEAISSLIGADSVRFLSVQRLRETRDNPDRFCYACFTGDYPLSVPLPESERTGYPRDTAQQELL